MQKYSIDVTVVRETGTRHPVETKVTWSARRVADPVVHIGRADISHSKATERDGVQSGYYESIKHAESLGETLALNDLEVTLEHVTEVLKRHKVASVQRLSSRHVGGFKDVFDEIMARKRPLL